MENRILVTGNTVKFVGFDEISDFATICVYDKKIVINSHRMFPVFGHIEVTLDEQKSFENEGVAALLSKRVSDTDWFICIKGTYYQVTE